MKNNPVQKDYGTVVIELVVVLGIILGAIMFITIITTNVWQTEPKQINMTHDYRLIASENSDNGFYVIDVLILNPGNVDKLVARMESTENDITIFRDERVINKRIDPENGEYVELIAYVGEYTETVDTISVPESL